MAMEVMKPQEEKREIEPKSHQITRRDFIDVLAKTSIVSAVFAVGVFAGGCGSGNSRGLGGYGYY